MSTLSTTTTTTTTITTAAAADHNSNNNNKNQSRTGTDGRLQLVGTSAACIKGPNTGSF